VERPVPASVSAPTSADTSANERSFLFNSTFS